MVIQCSLSFGFENLKYLQILKNTFTTRLEHLVTNFLISKVSQIKTFKIALNAFFTSQCMFLYHVHLCLRIKASILLWWKYGEISHSCNIQGQYFKSKGKKIPLIFVMHPYIITYMIDKETHEVSHRSDTYFQFIRST